MKRLYIISVILLIFCSCDRSLTQTKHYVGTPKDILQLHIGEAHMAIDNGEKGEILVYFFNKRSMVIGPNGNTSQPQFLAQDGSLIQDFVSWNYVIFLVDQEDIVYHTAKKFYRVSPGKLKRMMLEQYG
ncbi:hypothetical protein [Mongoliibacter ruber]|uniref:Uncharacterized protein n=1 Tax=Mongoliibacter ruber TaxID=1750599 RepID=A0A2T0WFM6_9BACT|nr:hypothetical protein [Mongoliibacter ruber]PRY85476.1 hypothetical protein CLW00_11257 [Mongoliibacter ruber]